MEATQCTTVHHRTAGRRHRSRAAPAGHHSTARTAANALSTTATTAQHSRPPSTVTHSPTPSQAQPTARLVYARREARRRPGWGWPASRSELAAGTPPSEPPPHPSTSKPLSRPLTPSSISGTLIPLDPSALHTVHLVGLVFPLCWAVWHPLVIGRYFVGMCLTG